MTGDETLAGSAEPACDRHDVRFRSGSDTCAAWLYDAAETTGPTPIVVMAHGLSGTRRDRLGPFAERFAAVGLAALVFDHRGFGDSTGQADLFRPSRQLEDWRAAIRYARSLDGIDPSRVVTFGSSMGGGNALAAAAEDPLIAAAISQVPFLDMRQAYPAALLVKARMMLAAVLNRPLPAIGLPSEAAFINAPDAAEGWLRVVAAGEESRWRNQVSSRWLVGRPFRPSRLAPKLHCPWLVCVGEADQVASPGPAITAARRAPRGELRTYPGVDHFDIYAGTHHQEVVADQIDFLKRHLVPRGTTR